MRIDGDLLPKNVGGLRGVNVGVEPDDRTS